MYNPDSTLKMHLYYIKGRLKKTEDFTNTPPLYAAYAKYDFNDFVNKWIKSTGLPPTHGKIVVSFTITADGQLIDPKLLFGIDKTLDDAVVDAIKAVRNGCRQCRERSL
jgi:hypothetical protein